MYTYFYSVPLLMISDPSLMISKFIKMFVNLTTDSAQLKSRSAVRSSTSFHQYKHSKQEIQNRNFVLTLTAALRIVKQVIKAMQRPRYVTCIAFGAQHEKTSESMSSAEII